MVQGASVTSLQLHSAYRFTGARQALIQSHPEEFNDKLVNFLERHCLPNALLGCVDCSNDPPVRTDFQAALGRMHEFVDTLPPDFEARDFATLGPRSFSMVLPEQKQEIDTILEEGKQRIAHWELCPPKAIDISPTWVWDQKGYSEGTKYKPLKKCGALLYNDAKCSRF